MKYPVEFAGTVKPNKKRGRRLGYPTANIPAPGDLDEGIYVGYVSVGGERRPSLVFIGASITFNETDRKAEVFVLDFEGELYGKTLEVSIEKKLRENKKFDSGRALMEQMQEDERSARAYFKTRS